MDNSDWTDGQMYGWMAVMGWMEYSDGWMTLMDGCMDGWMTLMDGCMDGWMTLMDGCMDGWMDDTDGI